MTIRMHRSTDLGAPVLTGQQGKMCDLLREVLCKGSAAATPTSITQTGGVATCTLTGHKFITGQTVSIFGADQADYNGNQVVTVTGANTFTFPVPSGTASPATGAITVGGQKTIGTPTSITRSGTTVTVALTAHGLAVGNRVYIMGATQAEYNGWQTVATQADANTFTFELLSTQTPATPATGTITCRYGDAGLGWSQLFTGTNKSIFKQGVSGSRVQGVLICNETDSSAHTRGAGLTFAEGATSLTAYTNLLYATESPANTGMLKSGTADSVARKWIVIGDHRTVMILTQPISGSTYMPLGWMCSYFGDFVSYLPNDLYPHLSGPAVRSGSYTFASTVNIANDAAYSSYGFLTYANYSYTRTTSADGNYPARVYRNHIGYTGYINVTLISVGTMLTINQAANGVFPIGSRSTNYAVDIFPDPVHGGINMDKLYVSHASTGPNSGDAVIRGELRGLWNPLHRRSQLSMWDNNDTFVGTGELSGKTFEIFDIHGSSGTNTGWFIIETSDTWGV